MTLADSPKPRRRCHPTPLRQPHSTHRRFAGSLWGGIACLGAIAGNRRHLHRQPGGAGTRDLPTACASCHGANLDDGADRPPLTGNDFRQKWGARSLDALMTSTSERMPPTQPGILGDVRYAQVIAFLLQENGVKPGTSELPSDPTVVASMARAELAAARRRWTRAPVVIPPAPPRTNPLDKIRPVTEAMLTKPARRRVAAVAAHLRRVRIQPAEEDQQNERQRPACRRGRWSLPNGAERVDADRPRRRAVRPQLRRQGAGARRGHRRSAVAVLAAAADRRRAERQARHLDLRHAPLRPDLRRPRRRARREDRQGRVGSSRSAIRRRASGSPAGRWSRAAK